MLHVIRHIRNMHTHLDVAVRQLLGMQRIIDVLTPRGIDRHNAHLVAEVLTLTAGAKAYFAALRVLGGDFPVVGRKTLQNLFGEDVWRDVMLE